MASAPSQYLYVNMSYYQYIPRDSIPEKARGFATTRVCDCVAGMISSAEGYGFFHYSYLEHPRVLKNYITRDFANATSVKITLIGGNLCALCIPWKIDDRELTLHHEGKELFGQETIDILSSVPLSFRVNFHDEHELDELFSKNLICKGKYFIYNESEINQTLRDRKYIANLHNLTVNARFEIKDVMDFVGYQNAETVKNICKVFDKNLVHSNSPIGGSVFCDFDGSIQMHDSYRSRSIDRSDSIDCPAYPPQGLYHLFNPFNDVERFYNPFLSAERFANSRPPSVCSLF